MSDFLIHAARMQDAGVSELNIRLGVDKDRTRIMFVGPAGCMGPWAMDRFPLRTFDLCGTDRVLERMKDDMSYSEDGPTVEKIQAAIKAHPLLGDDLREWFSDYSKMVMPTDEEIAAEVVDEAAVGLTLQYAKGMMRGLDMAQAIKTMKSRNDKQGE